MRVSSPTPRSSSTGRRAFASGIVVSLLAICVGGPLAVSSSACHCAALCAGGTEVTVKDAANALKPGPADFEVCTDATCFRFRFDGSRCDAVGDVGFSECSVASGTLHFFLPLEDVDTVSIRVRVSAANAAPGDPLLFESKTDAETMDLDVCGTTCLQAEAAFTIPP